MEEETRVHLLQDTSTQIFNGKLHATSANGESLTADTSSSITPMLVFSTFIVVLGSLSFGYVVGYTSPVQTEIMKELDLSIAEYSLFGSLSNIGGAMGAIVCGKATDYLGRRRALVLADVFYILGWSAIAAGQGAWLLDVGRWMLGFAMSITGYAVPAYVAEFTPKNLRGGFVILHVLMVTLGASVVFLIGVITPWRTLALIGIIPSLIQIVGLFFIPESPRWLVMISKFKEFEAALLRFRGASVDISQEAADIKDCAEVFHQKPKVRIHQLLQKKYAYTLTVGIGLQALSMLVGLNGILSYSRSIFESAGFSGIVGTVALAIFQLPSVALGTIFMDKCGRRPLLMVSAAGLCLGCLLAALSFVFQGHHLLEGISPYLALIGILIYVAAYPMGVGGVSAVIISEIYPLNIKGLAGSTTSLVSWILGWLVSYAFNFSMDWSRSGTFFILAGVSAFTIIFVAKLVPETKGKTLEEVHMSMGNI